nr:60S ribosomal protein L4-like [Coffea arabica]
MRKVPVNKKWFAVVSAIAASAVPSLVMARSHRIESVLQIPCVISDFAEAMEKTSNAISLLKKIGAYLDAEKESPLVAYGIEGAKLVKAFRNIPGIDMAHVDHLNLLKLAPGDHVRRFIVWTKSAFEKLDEIYRSFDRGLKQSSGKLEILKHFYNLNILTIFVKLLFELQISFASVT